MACRGLKRKKVGQQRGQAAVLLLSTSVLAMMAGTTYVAAQTAPAQQSVVQAGVRTFNILAQPLRSGISEFNRQSGVQVSQASGSIPAGTRTNAVSGQFTPQEALRRMLSGTGISYRFIGNDSAVIGGAAQSASNVSGEDATTLDPIVITSSRGAASGSGFQGTPDWVYETPSAISVITREAIQNSGARNVRDVLDRAAGVTTNRTEGQNPGIAVNIRGLQDQNRIVTMVDGARQNFQRSAHGATQRAYVDSAFIRTIDIEKSGTSGVGGAGALGGSVNFRTIVADDLIHDGRDWGVEFNGTTGTNKFKFDGSIAGAVRLSDSFSILGGVAYRTIGQYKVGKRENYNLPDLVTSEGYSLFTGQEVLSTLLKAEAELSDDTKLTLGWSRYDSDSSQGVYNLVWDPDDFRSRNRIDEDKQRIINDSYTADFEWDPDSELIDLKVRLWYNRVDNEEDRTPWGRAYSLPIDYTLGTIGGSIENTSRFSTQLGELSFNYGVEAFHDDGKTSVNVDDVTDSNGLDATYSFRGANPTGKRDVVSGFSSVTLEHDDWLTITGGLRYDWYRTTGSTVIVGDKQIIYHPASNCLRYFPSGECRTWGTQAWNEITYPEYDINVDKSGGALLPSLTVAFQPTDWLQPFAKYSRTYRPPTLMESLWGGRHDILSSPNSYAPNPWLEPEEADTYEIGVNISRDGVFKPDDSLRVKLVGFYREIDNYIGLGTVFRQEANTEYDSWVNLEGTSKMRGVELEANYDAGRYYAGVSYSYLSTDYSDTYTYDGQEYTANDAAVYVPPKNKVTIDAGMRFFEEKLTLGGRLTYAGDSTPARGTLSGQYETEAYTVYDVYGSYAFNDSTKLRFAVNNVTDETYIPALGTAYLPAPGRTFTASLNVKF